MSVNLEGQEGDKYLQWMKSNSINGPDSLHSSLCSPMALECVSFGLNLGGCIEVFNSNTAFSRTQRVALSMCVLIVAKERLSTQRCGTKGKNTCLVWEGTKASGLKFQVRYSLLQWSVHLPQVKYPNMPSRCAY